MKITMEQWGALGLLLIVFFVALAQSFTYPLPSLCGDSLECRVLLVNATKDISFCTGFNQSSECALRSALALRNTSPCNMTVNSSECVFAVAKSLVKPELCLQIPQTGECVFQIAYENQNSSLCEVLVTDKERCYFSYALAYKSKELCSKTGRYQQTCLKRT